MNAPPLMTTPAKPEPRPVITYPRDAIVEMRHLVAALGATDDTVRKMDLPCFYVGNRPRFVWGQVLDELSRRATPDAKPATPAPRERRKRRKRAEPRTRIALEASS